MSVWELFFKAAEMEEENGDGNIKERERERFWFSSNSMGRRERALGQQNVS